MKRAFALIAALSLGGCVTSGPLPGGAPSHGIASFYAEGARTANGEHFRPGAMTAAHRTLPFGTHVRVTDADTGRSVVVRINDRGPFVRGRIIDLSRGAASALGMAGRGVANVNLEVEQ